MVQYQEDFAEWTGARTSATKGAEGLIESVTEEFGWAWVNKEDADIFWPWMIKAWAAQLVIILVYFGGILFLMKRKDAR
jgi:hypothetical protein